jgi:hypothetical protein
MRVTKDRPGFVRKIAGMWRKSDRTQEAAIFIIDSTKAQMEYAITVPMLEDEMESNKEYKKQFEDNSPNQYKIKANQRIAEFVLIPYEKEIEVKKEILGVNWKVNDEVFKYFLQRKQLNRC